RRRKVEVESPGIQPDRPCYVIYTSGSTGKPKGVQITHSNLIPLLLWFHDYFRLGPHIKVLQNLSYTFDFGIFELVTTLLAGGTLYFFDRKSLKDLNDYVDFIHRHQIDTIHTTPSFFTTIIDLGKSLSPVKLLHFGGERLTKKIVEDASRLVGKNCYIYNGYGPTETTINSAIFSMQVDTEGRIEVPETIPIGRPSANNIIYILDGYGNFQPIGVVGELYIGGSGAAAGYVNRPELTAEKFQFDFYKSNKFYRAYKTGDLGRWLPDGNIEFLGRIDYQVKIRGFRIELGEIENRLLEHEEIKEAVVIDIDSEARGKYLCGYIVPKSQRQGDAEGVPGAGPGIHETGSLGTPHLREYLSRELPDYMIPAYFVFLENIPLNPNGKVDRKALPLPEVIAGDAYTAPRDETELKLAKIWSEVLALEQAKIGVDDSFFDLGGHSLKAAVMVAKLHRESDVVVTLAEVFKSPTIKGLARCIERKEKSRFLGLSPVETKEYYTSSPAQKRFFFFQQLEPENVSYNMFELMIAAGRIEKEKFAGVFKKLIQRHESLRTSFKVVEGDVVQEVRRARDIRFEIEFYDVSSILEAAFDSEAGVAPAIYEIEPAAGIVKNFIRPFDLSKAPLLRVGLIKTSAGEAPSHILMVDMHHIISDGTSTGIFIADFLSFYRGEEPLPLKIRYRDYVQWLLDRRKKEEKKEYIDRDIVDEELLELPSDYIRPAVQSFAGASARFVLGKEVKEALNSLALKEDSTLFMVLFAIFNIFLSKLSGQENIILGSPIAGRLHDDLEGIVGLFINTLAIRNYPAPGKSFPQFLKEVKENSLYAFESQEHQYEELLEKVTQAGSSGRNPLFDVMFVLQNMEMPELKIPGLRITRNVQKEISSKFDMTLYCEEIGEELTFKLEYCTQLFKPGTIKRFIKYFKKVVSVVLADPGKTIGEIEFIPDEEKREILYDFNDTEVDYPRHKTIYRLFEEQVERTPGNTAIWGSLAAQEETEDRETGIKRAGEALSPVQGTDKKLTYKQLNERANRLSRLLRDKGVKANSVVGIMLERSIELVEAIYAVLKAGGAYLPIDPEYPEKRILTMLEQGKAVTLLTRKEPVEKKEIGDITCPVLNLDDLAAEIAALPGENLPPLSGPEDLIYIIFTSGSTGVPKGAGVYQRSFVNLVNWFVKDFDLKAADRNLLMTSFSFDLTQKNFYASLILGGVLCVPSMNYFDPGAILRDIEERGVTWINCTPSMFFQVIEFCKEDELKKLSALRYVYLGGEPLSMSMFMKWVESKYCNGVIVNTYGPTECTDISNAYRITEPRRFLEEAVPIGEPVYNVKLYVTDKNLQLLPLGIAGELLIGGESVGIGYVNDEELTKKKFVSHSFGEGEPGQAPATLYRTGDLVKWLPGGRIEFIGRIDFQVKIRGFRIEIGEIESRLLDHEKIKEIIVIDRDDGSGGKYLCAYFVAVSLSSVQAPAAAELKEYLSNSLPDYMIPSYFVELAEMPLNPNGKVNRKALPMPDTASTREYTAPRNKLEDMLVDIWSKILGMDRGRIGIDDSFFELGGHSLKATALAARIHQQLDVDIPLREIFKTATIRGLSVYIGREEKSKYEAIYPVEEKAYYPLSAAQKRLYLVQQMDAGNMTYNMPMAMVLEGEPEKERLRTVFRQLLERHESFRTSFVGVDGRPVQEIHSPEEIEFEIEYFDLATEGDGQSSPHHSSLIIHNSVLQFIRPFDLSQAPLLRVVLLKMEPAKYLLLVDMHHIISDGTSVKILIDDFMDLYAGKELAPLRLQYKDFSEWQHSEKGREAVKKQEQYWLEQFSGDIPVLKLPYDFPRPAKRSFAGAVLGFEIDGEKTLSLRKLADEEGVTLFMVLLAVYNVLLSKLSWSEDIAVGSPVVGRRSVDVRQIIGMFINTIAIRNYPAGSKTFRDFLKEVKEKALAAFENQDYPFEELIEKVAPSRETSHNPLFDTMFTLQDIGIPEASIPGLTLKPYDYEHPFSRFDLTWNGVDVDVENPGEKTKPGPDSSKDSGKKLVFTIEYSTALFKEEKIKSFAGFFEDIVDIVIAGRDICLKDIDISSGLSDLQELVSEEASGDFGF
ncbi:MAG: amino acid adenylation domain-containing protein, partial [Candidatus Aminicenantes bacterium]|nr:amino acid adenylation domain-containing protein [Candidatus Aminicenantes bacterium]